MSFEKHDTIGKRPLVLFTGGLDSTYLVNVLLAKTDIDILYIDGHQGEAKVAKEKKAREKIIATIATLGLNHKIVRSYVYQFKGEFEVSEAWSDRFLRREAFDHNLVGPQALHWFFGALSVVDPMIHSSVKMGYILGDSIGPRLNSIKNAWEWMSCAVQRDTVPLEFDLECYDKTTILTEIHPRLQRHVWSCEGQTEEPCGRCVPCATRIGAIAKWEALKSRSYSEFLEERLNPTDPVKGEIHVRETASDTDEAGRTAGQASVVCSSS